jgi:hypothetical protein
VSSEVTRERGSDSTEVPRGVMGVDELIHMCTSEFRHLGYWRLENRKFGTASSEVESSEIP